jgi:hypothetical protein
VSSKKSSHDVSESHAWPKGSAQVKKLGDKGSDRQNSQSIIIEPQAVRPDWAVSITDDLINDFGTLYLLINFSVFENEKSG